MKVIRRDYGQGSNSQEQKLDSDDNLLLDRLVYRVLGSLTDNKSIVTPTDIKRTDLDRFLLDMNNLHNKKYYPILATALPQPTPDILALDEYLGSLGVTEQYPFSQDTYNVEPWVEIEAVAEMRVLMDLDDNTYLTDSSGNEVLVRII